MPVRIPDILFGIQLLGAFLMCGSQYVRLLETTDGQLLSMLIILEVNLLLQLALALGAHRAQPSRVTRQTITIYLTWLVLICSNFVAFYQNGTYKWSENDGRVFTYAFVGVCLVGVSMPALGLPYGDPIGKSVLAMLFKSMPQFVMVFEVASKGGAGIPGIAVVVGNMTILLRLAQLTYAIREAGWDRNRVWLFASEAMNELSWACVSIMWLIQWRGAS